MATVYKVSEPGGETTRLYLPESLWGHTVQSRLRYYGYTVTPTEEPCDPDTRDAAELARRDALLDWAAPDEM
jgi:hypothetical protein